MGSMRVPVVCSNEYIATVTVHKKQNDYYKDLNIQQPVLILGYEYHS